MSLRRIAEYTITREQGRGGMGTVFQALSPDGATVAGCRATCEDPLPGTDFLFNRATAWDGI
jgi:hypothetical protein